ncbi:hypothetical protein DOTSEDRAFT_26612 [Dothistroma septosporum NZE10]|uniref:Uncharacterized protein n=1 Tax=Dothistroma septosporum (strain NZE10 / CBS 128990) TaxID=675120 RepID=N1PH31_DOTSN|nr:hypothetical protein DOTSEDRAFT_26612 [Dothistroma septosporum NZE10]
MRSLQDHIRTRNRLWQQSPTSNAQGPDWRLNLHTWSQFPPIADGTERGLTYQELVDFEDNPFEQNYSSLLEGLTRLTNVHILRYAGNDDTEPGFCHVSCSTAMKHSKQRVHWQSCFGGEGQPPLPAALRTQWWSDA